ncbi:DUF1016 N-terminal domain-containing protein [Paraburkholderia lacunae]|uniref:DUF1016 N-terminal domain-containing protein n=1 Tax=Paraburkholderia lacunae TaxID=2211104 RepID=UPI003CC683D9
MVPPSFQVHQGRILSAVRRELSWTHLKSLLYIDDPLKRDFYLELCRLERWSSRVTVMRALKRLTELGAIELRQRRIWVIDPSRLPG